MTNRRTIHSFSSEKVLRKVIDNSITVAIHAPNHKHTWPWRFFLAGPRSRRHFGELALQLKGAKSELSDAVRESMRKKYNEQGELVVAAILKSEDAEVTQENYASMAAALQNMALYLHSEGYGSKWSTGAILRNPTTFEILKLNPTEYEICGFFWIGKPAITPVTPNRPSVDEFLIELD